jgi:NAD(P)-dependent dehydrogenase (short-subunit alcohol dehydrogenase family)
VTMRGDRGEEANCCQRAVEQTVTEVGDIDLLVNNAGTQQPVTDLTELTTSQWERTFRVNIYSYFWTTRAACAICPMAAPSLTPHRSAACAVTKR